MKLFIGLVCRRPELCEFFQNEKEKIIPKDLVRNNPLVKQLYATFLFGAYNPLNMKNALSLDAYLLKATRNADGAILMIEEEQLSSDSLKNAYFCASIEIPEGELNFKNFLVSKVAKLLKNFSSLWETMNRADNEQAMILPLRNFSATELKELAAICREETLNTDFGNKIRPKITALKKRKKPRRSSNYATKYFADDNDRYFVFGKELHSQIATGPPHTITCQITGNFRFGKRISTQQHFNVMHQTEGHLLNGVFPNCHDEQIHVSDKTHLNMFSNDFH